MSKFRASFSVLSTWESGQWERAIKMYFKLDKFTTRQMAVGKDFHKKWENCILKTNKLPDVFGSKELSKPKPEFKKVIQIEDWLELVGVIDCIDKETIYEFKTGITTSESYASTMQPAVYAYIAKESGFDVKKVVIYHHNQYTNRQDMSIVWIDDELVKKAKNWVVTVSSEMHSYFEENKLYERFGLLNK